MYLRFKTKEEAEKALVQINKNQGNPKPGINAQTKEIAEGKGLTETWAELKLCDDGCYTIPKPEEKDMKNVTGYKEEEYNQEWFSKSDAKAEEEEAQIREELITRESIKLQIIAEEEAKLEAEIERRLSEANK